MTHADTDIEEILKRFRRGFVVHNSLGRMISVGSSPSDFEDFITRECLALKKKWEREHFDNQ